MLECRLMSAKPWIITGSACGFVTATLAGIKFVQISQAMALMESFPPAYETVTCCRRRGGRMAAHSASEWHSAVTGVSCYLSGNTRPDR
jgi:predicted permease